MKAKSIPSKTSDLPAGLSNPARRGLAASKVHRLSDLRKFSEAEVAGWHGIGPNAIKELRRALKARGWSFAK